MKWLEPLQKIKANLLNKFIYKKNERQINIKNHKLAKKGGKWKNVIKKYIWIYLL